jgi:hypothetical protein
MMAISAVTLTLTHRRFFQCDEVNQNDPKIYSSVFIHRVCAAFLALSLLSLADIRAARAGPPFSPPRRPSATANGSFPFAIFGTSPAAIASTME